MAASDILRRPHLVRAVRIMVTTLVVGVFFVTLVLQAGTLRNFSWQIEPFYLLAAAAVAVARGPVVVYPWWRIVRSWGYDLPWGRAIRLYFHSGLARYLPGQWWFVLGRAHLAEKEGVEKRATAASTVLETFILTGTAAAIALLGMATIPAMTGSAVLLLGLSIALSGLLLASPQILSKASTSAARWLRGRSEMLLKLTWLREKQLTAADSLKIFAGCCSNWLLYGSTAWLLLIGVAGSEYLGLGNGLAVVGLFAASVLGGSLGFVVPQGLLIREGALVYLLYTLLGVPIPVGLAVAALARLFSVGAEGLWALVGLRL